MIKSTTPRVYDALSGATAIINAYSTIENQVDSDYIIRTWYFREDENANRIHLLVFEEKYTVEDIDAMFESLREMLGALPFTQMLRTAVELSLFQHLSTHVKFGVEIGSGGWEIV